MSIINLMPNFGKRQKIFKETKGEFKVMNKVFKILDSLPTYGEMAINIQRDKDYKFVSQGFVVEFYPKNIKPWIGNFEVGCFNKFGVFTFDNNIVYVLSGGILYKIDINLKNVIKIFDFDVNEFIKTDYNLICSDNQNIYIINKNGSISKKYEDVALDGITDLKLEGELLKGKAYQLFENNGSYWHNFYIDLLNNRVVFIDKPKEPKKNSLLGKILSIF